MERLQTRRKTGLGRNALRTWGVLLLAIGVISRGILQNRVLGLGRISGPELLTIMESSDTMMMFATSALVMEVIGTCAIPIFAFLLAEGARHTSNLLNYLKRVALVAATSELPYNLVVSGKLFDLSSQNPVFGLVLALILIWFYQRCAEKKVSHVLTRIMITAAAVVWCWMLRIEYGAVLVLTCAVLWLLWDKPLIRNIAGACVVLMCSMFSLFLMAAPMAFLAIHIYNGEKGEENRKVTYMAYPLLLTLVALTGLLLF